MGLLEGKTVIVTGAGKADSLGYGVATAFAREGADLVVTGRSKSRLASARELEEFGHEVLPLVVDGVGAEGVPEAVDEAAAHFGRIDALVNCAQLAKVGTPLADTSLDDFRQTIDSGLVSAFAWMKACFSHLKATHGSVVNFASASASSGAPGEASLAAAKEGVRGLTRVAAAEWAADGVTANVVCPLVGGSEFDAWAEEFPEEGTALLAQVPMGRLGEAEADVGGLCVFLCGPAARCLTGQTICVTGGMYLRP